MTRPSSLQSNASSMEAFEYSNCKVPETAAVAESRRLESVLVERNRKQQPDVSALTWPSVRYKEIRKPVSLLYLTH